MPAQDGIADVFADVAALANLCRFNDCTHETEPGCAIQSAVKRGDITSDRLVWWNKLVAEERFNSASLAERKSDDEALHKMIRAVQKTIESKTMIREYTSNDTDALIAIWEKANVLAHPFLAPEFVAFVKDAMRNMYLPNAQTWVYANGLGWCGAVDNHTDFVCIKQRIPSQPFSRP